MTMRVRFPPSPTGYLHVGAARTALYNWMYARRHGGTLVFRIDDTDAERSSEEYYEDIVAGLRWLGIDWDEGVEAGGPSAPYRQSERIERYREAAAELVASGAAYHDFATAEQMDAFRQEAQAAGTSPAYDGRFRLSEEETAARLAAGEIAPVRFAVPRPGEMVFTDAVRGELRFDHEDVDDFVILRSDGSPTYHLASTVDDVDFGMTHIIRGEDLLPSTPKHILLTRALGAEPAVYAHMSLLTGDDGRKLSKRHGATALKAFREQGILPEAMVNFLAILGWSPGEDEEVLPLETLVERFDIYDTSSNPAVFDLTKLEWMNGIYIRELPESEFVARTLPLVEAHLGRSLDPAEQAAYLSLAPLVQERARVLSEVPPQVAFLFVAVEWDEASWEKVMTAPEARAAVDGARGRLAALDEWTTPAIESALRGMLEEMGLSARKGLQPIRVAVTGSVVSPPLFESLEALGRDETISRLQAAFERI